MEKSVTKGSAFLLFDETLAGEVYARQTIFRYDASVHRRRRKTSISSITRKLRRLVRRA